MWKSARGGKTGGLPRPPTLPETDLRERSGRVGGSPHRRPAAVSPRCPGAAVAPRRPCRYFSVERLRPVLPAQTRALCALRPQQLRDARQLRVHPVVRVQPEAHPSANVIPDRPVLFRHHRVEGQAVLVRREARSVSRVVAPSIRVARVHALTPSQASLVLSTKPRLLARATARARDGNRDAVELGHLDRVLSSRTNARIEATQRDHPTGGYNRPSSVTVRSLAAVMPPKNREYPGGMLMPPSGKIVV